jgi:2-polyprenyl-6-methoxyphenol hydroxylase-like FAD-dependent oxidoreductase
MKIIIIGAGISGLTAALALQNYVAPNLFIKEPLEIKIYDESQVKSSGEVEYSWRDHSDIRNQQQDQDKGRKKNQGAAISLQSNAFKVLRELDANLADRVYASGLPCKGFTWKSRGNWELGREDLEACLISRPVLIECLMEALLERGIKVEYRSVGEVEIKEGKRPVVRFSEDGGDDEVADLVVGADGIRSVVRKSLFGDGEEVRPKYLQVLPPTLSMVPNSLLTNKQRQLRRRRRSRPSPIHSSSNVLLRRPTYNLRPRPNRNLWLRRPLANLTEQTHLFFLLRHRSARPRFQARPSKGHRSSPRTTQRLGGPDDSTMSSPN